MNGAGARADSAINFGSVCSGIEAASVAWCPLGWQTSFVSEIDPFACALLNHHHPAAPNFGDMNAFTVWPSSAIDVLVGGTPCQSFSVAGLRAGLADPRGNLALVYLAIVERYSPRWVVWENVPGVLSSDGGRAFGSFIGGLGELGYGYAWRVFDAQHFGLAQRRKRVFVVGCLGSWASAAAVLFESQSLRGDPAPRREARKNVAGAITASAARRGGVDDPERGGLIAHALRAEGFDASEDDTGRGTPLVPVAFGGNNTQGTIEVATTLSAHGSPRLDFESDTLLCFDETQITSSENRCNPQPGDPSHPLAAGARPATIAFNARQDPDAWSEVTGPLDTDGSTQAIAFDCKSSGQNGFGAGEIASTLRAMNSNKRHNNGGGQLAVAYDMRGRDGGAQFEGPHDTANIRASSGGSSRSYVATHAVRRLTPRECERLQGFPDDYTLIPYRGRPAMDGPRYKALGNSMAVPVMRWIGARIERFSERRAT